MLKTKDKINQIDKDTILSNMSEGVLAIDNNKRLLMINKTGEEYLDIKSNLIIGQTADVVISDKRFLKFIDDLLLSKKNLKEEIKIKNNLLN